MSKKVLILSGSPRKGGNSDNLCKRTVTLIFLSVYIEQGNSVGIIHTDEIFKTT